MLDVRQFLCAYPIWNGLVEMDMQENKRDQRLSNIEADIVEIKADIAELREQGAKRSDIAELREQGAKRDERLSNIEEDIKEIKKNMASIMDDTGFLKGMVLESNLALRIRSIAAQRFDLRRPRVMRSSFELMDEDLQDALDEALNDNRITRQEQVRIEATDIILSARRKQDGSEIWIVFEVSYTIGSEDIDRAKKSAEILSRLLGVSTVAAAVGRSIPPNILRRAESAGVEALTVNSHRVKDGFDV